MGLGWPSLLTVDNRFICAAVALVACAILTHLQDVKGAVENLILRRYLKTLNTINSAKTTGRLFVV